MKIDIRNIKSKIVSYFKDQLDQAAVVIILFVTLANAIFVSVIFYIAVLSPSNLSVDNKDYKYVRIKVDQGVLEKLNKRKEVNQDIISEIEQVKNPFK